MNSRQVAIVSAFLGRLGFGAVTFLVPYSLGIEEAAMVGLIIALRPSVEMMAAVPAGMLSDFVGRKTTLILGLISTGSILFMFSEVSNPSHLALLSATMGLSSALVITSALALMIDASTPEERGGAVGSIVAALSAGSFVGFISAGFLISKLDEHVPYVTIGLLTVAAGTICFRCPVPALHQFRKLKSPTGVAASIRRQTWLLLSILIILILVSTATVFLPLYARTTKLSPSLAAGSYVALILIALASYVAGGRLSDKWGRLNIIYGGLILVFVAEVGLVWGYSSESWGFVFPLLALASVGIGAYAPSALALLRDLFPKNSRGVAMGTYDSLLSISEVMGPAITGALIALSGFSALAVFGAVVTVVDILIIAFRPAIKV